MSNSYKTQQITEFGSQNFNMIKLSNKSYNRKYMF